MKNEMVNGSAKPSAADERCYIYIIGTSAGAYKVGIASDPEKRHKALKSGIPDPSRLLLKIEVANRAIALYVERELHGILRQYHTQGEWFRPPKSTLGELLLDLGEKIEAFRPEAPLIQYQTPSAKFGDCGNIQLEDDSEDPTISKDAEEPPEAKPVQSPFEPAAELKQICMNCRHWAPDPEQNYERGLCARMPIDVSRILLLFGPLVGDTACVLAKGGHETDVFWTRVAEGRDLHVFEYFQEIPNSATEADGEVQQ